jgi:Heparinase II/III-like protein/Heparinase II/III N-terminus
MSATEMAWRISDQGRKWRWSRHQVAPADNGPAGVGGTQKRPRLGAPPSAVDRPFMAFLPFGAVEQVPLEARKAVIAAADELLAGRWEALGVMRTDMHAPDWFLDPLTAKRAPQSEYCFRVDHRDEQVTGNVKQVWELSRLHHITVLAAAFAFSGDDRYAERVAAHLRSWWRENPFLSGINWTSGIEVGVRLISWVWARRLLEGWTGAPGLFEENRHALTQIWWHQRYLAAFRSRGSSSNNHVIAEAAGQLVASLAFNWFDESDRWASQAADLLEAQLHENTFGSGVNREMAFEYHGFVAELALVAAAEADLAGRPLGDRTWELIARMLDVVAATLDEKSRAPRYGDGDDGRALTLDPGANRWESLLCAGQAILGTPEWWPHLKADALGTFLSAMSWRHPVHVRPARRPATFPDAGLTIMRSDRSEGPEIWCRCDAGPHGFLSIAAHAHADALGVEIRYGGVDIIADPGTYCYHGEPRWRKYFRSTLAHNTLELAGQDQSSPGGPFLWDSHARSRLVALDVDRDGEATLWSAQHDGYRALDPPATHRRTVRLSSEVRRLEITDEVSTVGAHSFRLSFHLGPDVSAVMRHQSVELEWEGGQDASATLELPAGATWRVARGEVDPPLGWYSPRFGKKQPTITLVGEGTCTALTRLVTILQFHPAPSGNTEPSELTRPGYLSS